uniref:Uncharacterized protein n=1 Tax=Kalanchoe fedtschenkoi TaxID=63787 RepID=A0A7N0TGU9_KALFE
MANSPAPFSDIGKRAKEILTKDYNVGHKFTIFFPSSTGMGLTATGLKRDHVFFGDINAVHKCGNTTVDVKIDSDSNILTKVTQTDIFPNTKTAISFNIPDHKSGKLDVHYTHPHAAIFGSIGLNPTPVLELSAAIGTKELSLGGEIALDTASATFTKQSVGISFNKPDFSASLISGDRGETLKGSYIHELPSNATTVAAELTHRFSSRQNSFTIGSAHKVNPTTLVKTRFSDNGKVAMLCQREWRPKSLVTFSAEYDTKARHSASKFGLSLALKP